MSVIETYKYIFQSNVIPVKTNFSCIDKTAGFYADVDTRCKIYHTCDEFGNKFTYQCPEETAFRQDALICDHAHLVKCQGSVPSNTEMQKEKYNNSSCAKGSTDNINCHFFFKSLQEIQPIKIYNAEQRGFAFSSQDILNNFNATKVGENKIIKFFHPPLNNYNPTTNVPLDRFTNIKTQHVPFTNQNQQNRSTIEENSSVPSQIINDKVKFNVREETNQKTNDALYNFLKYSLNTFPEKVQDQQNNMNNHHIIKNSPDFLKLSFMNHRNYPYTETLNSIQKITKMPSTTINTSLTTTEVPLYALTLSLKPLVPNEQEHDPYYPKFSTSTESYYTPSHSDNKQPHIKVYTQTWSNTHIKLPPVLPDLNSLEDIVDRRKQFYIPRIKFD
ncbi:uncharacterized protein LOC122400581 [Colletes gigas]|uniref:uncharacterized protein LOC122400581 n=1 Tax=Colletes gigas TaxID=935657 RepID=UPI001C9BBA12|nr:uncharacterized protein LOC122400581 [Colletes gigas]